MKSIKLVLLSLLSISPLGVVGYQGMCPVTLLVKVTLYLLLLVLLLLLLFTFIQIMLCKYITRFTITGETCVLKRLIMLFSILLCFY